MLERRARRARRQPTRIPVERSGARIAGGSGMRATPFDRLCVICIALVGACSSGAIDGTGTIEHAVIVETPGRHEAGFLHDGVARSFLYYIPASYDGEPRPLI